MCPFSDSKNFGLTEYPMTLPFSFQSERNSTLFRRMLCWFAMCLVAGLSLFAIAAGGYKEKPGAKDHPLLSRFQGSILVNFGTINFERVEVPTSVDKKEAVEGKVLNYFYVAPKDRSDLEVFRSYKQALESGRFKVLFACEDAPQCQAQRLYEHASRWTSEPKSFVGGYSPITRMDGNGNYPPRFLVARLTRPEGDVTVVLTVQPPSSTQQDNGVGGPYFIQIIESGAMQAGNVIVNADALSKGLATEGKIALYGVYFDTGKAEVKPESKAQLDEMANLLKQNKSLKVYIIGHTDNQGALEANLALSQKRAEAIAAALVNNYKIDAKRVQARGVANFAPVASNGSDAGRAKNRRVELVEQ